MISLLSGDVFSATTPLMHKHMRTFKLVYWWHCLTQPRRWLAHHRHRRMYLSG